MTVNHQAITETLLNGSSNEAPSFLRAAGQFVVEPYADIR
jgi:hypothetical protein